MHFRLTAVAEEGIWMDFGGAKDEGFRDDSQANPS